MKKSLFFAAFACCLVACQSNLEKDVPEERPANTIVATMADSDTKTVLSPGENGISTVLWSEGDQIAVFLNGGSNATAFTLSEGAGSKQAEFTGEGKGDKYVAFYPYKMVSSMSGDNVRINLPLEQEYQVGTFASGTFPMLASAESPNLSFYNLASILRLSITGKHSVTRIVFKSAKSDIKVCGQATASVSGNKLTVTSSGKDSLVLTVPGVKLSESQPTDFYLVLPPQTYKGGFTVRVYTNERYMDKTLATDFTMVRSKMHKADAFEFTPNGTDVSETLQGMGTENNPFLVESLSDLLLVRNTVNESGSINEVQAVKAYYLLTADIDLTPVCSESSRKNWVPIGNAEHPFEGVFDGGGHSLEGLYINATSDNQALFGIVSGGSLSNIIVKGAVINTASNTALLVANISNATIAECFVEGSVTGGSDTGGVVGYAFRGGEISGCINRADISGGSYTAGIVGYAYACDNLYCINYGNVTGGYSVGGIGGCAGDYTLYCSNYGDITGRGNNTGGIIGNNNNGFVVNCINEGAVSGSSNTGGLTGYSRQGARIWNDVNRGEVSGSSNVGGISGILSSNSSYQRTTNMHNCVNLGEVLCSSESAGGLCGFNEGPNTEWQYDASEATQNYWLWDRSLQKGMEKGIGSDEGVSGSNFPLTLEQMKGASYGDILYGSYDNILDALNGWAYRNINSISAYNMWGWMKDQTDECPVLTGVDAMQPGSGGTVFKVTPTSVKIESSLGGDFTVDVTSTAEYDVSTPDWISEGGITWSETNPYVKTHHFTAGANNSGSVRSGSVTFTNSEGTVLNVSVKQDYAYLNVDASQLVFSGNGGAKRFNITSSVAWTVTSDASWISVVPASGEGNETVSVRAAANEAYQAREATLVVSSVDGTFTHSLSLIQSGKVPEGQEQDWKEASFVHQSVAMRFTATWCGWCPRMNKSIKRAQELYPDKIQHLALHGGGSDLQFSQVDPLMNLYSISGFPTGIIDGRTEVNNSEIEYTANTIVQIVKETEETYGTLTGAAITSSVSDRTANIVVDAYLKKSGNYKLTVLLVEDNIINAQSDYEEGDHERYTHDCVARVAVTNVLGDSFTVDSDLSVEQFSYSVNVPSSYKLGNMRVFVYIQREFGSYPVIQSSSSYGNYFIDNCATVDLGGSLKLALEGGSGGGGGGEGDGNEGITPGDDIDM